MDFFMVNETKIWKTNGFPFGNYDLRIVVLFLFIYVSVWRGYKITYVIISMEVYGILPYLGYIRKCSYIYIYHIYMW